MRFKRTIPIVQKMPIKNKLQKNKMTSYKNENKVERVAWTYMYYQM